MARTSKGPPGDSRALKTVEGQWTGDIPSFLGWCAAVEDLDAYRAALTGVPPNAAWNAVLRSLRAGIEHREHPSESGPRVRTPDVFLTSEPEGAELRAAKRTILEAEITRRALS